MDDSANDQQFGSSSSRAAKALKRRTDNGYSASYDRDVALAGATTSMQPSAVQMASGVHVRKEARWRTNRLILLLPGNFFHRAKRH